MHKNTILFVILALFAGFVGGFWLANSINRSAMNTVGPQKIPANSNNSQSKSDLDLSDDEINAKIAEGERNPTDLAFQKELGISLYTYSAMKRDGRLLPKAVQILERANSLNPKDFEVLVALGHAHFDIGFAEKNISEFQKAREIYAKALAIKPDENVQTDLGISYVVQQPPTFDKGVTELQKVLDVNPKNERALLYLGKAFVGQNQIAAAEKTLAKLKSVAPNNQSLPELTSLIADAKAGAPK